MKQLFDRSWIDVWESDDDHIIITLLSSTPTSRDPPDRVDHTFDHPRYVHMHVLLRILIVLIHDLSPRARIYTLCVHLTGTHGFGVCLGMVIGGTPHLMKS